MKNKSLFTAALLLMSTGIACAQTEVVAHRGHWDIDNSAQNSLVALYKAHEIGIYGSEFDVLVTADGVPVVNHDSTIDDLLIETTDYTTLRDKRLKNGEVLPTLEQYFAVGRSCPDLMLVLEIKSNKTKEKEISSVADILALVDKYELADRIEYISFSMNICKELKRLRPEAAIYYLTGDVRPSEIKELGFAGIDYHYLIFAKNPGWISEAKESGLLINVWTVNDPEVMKTLVSQEVDYITTDKPELLQELIKSNK